MSISVIKILDFDLLEFNWTKSYGISSRVLLTPAIVVKVNLNMRVL